MNIPLSDCGAYSDDSSEDECLAFDNEGGYIAGSSLTQVDPVTKAVPVTVCTSSSFERPCQSTHNTSICQASRWHAGKNEYTEYVFQDMHQA